MGRFRASLFNEMGVSLKSTLPIEAGILREITGGNYGRVWVAEELVKLIEVDD